jgi:hypothetical protein
MKPDETSAENTPSPRHHPFELYYYEQVGSRFYFRITPFAIILVVVALLIILAIRYMDERAHPTGKINLQTSEPIETPFDANKQVIQPAPSPGPQSKPIKQSVINVPAPILPKAEGTTNNALTNTPAQAKSNRNSNER